MIRAPLTGSDADARTLASGRMWVPVGMLDIEDNAALALLNARRAKALSRPRE